MRIHGTTKRQVAAMFFEGKIHLLLLHLDPLIYLDGCVRDQYRCAQTTFL